MTSGGPSAGLGIPAANAPSVGRSSAVLVSESKSPI